MSKMQFFFYRAATFWASFKAIYKLSEEKVEAFIKSFDVFSHDWRDEDKLKKAYGENYYEVIQQKLCDYYSVLNLVCSLGSVEKMYIPSIVDPKKSLAENQNLFEERMIRDLDIQAADRVLDIGCGRGRIAAHVARVTNSHVTGINIDDEQLSQAKRFAKQTKLDKQTDFKKGDMNDIPFPFQEGTFDAVYHVQAFSYAKDLTKLLKEVHRVLKPGGRMSSCDWATLDNYDPHNREHVNLVERIKPLLGAVGTPSKEEYLEAFRQAGFKILKAEVPSATKTDDVNIEKASKEFTLIHKLVNFLVKVRLLPRHFKILLEQINQNVDAFIEVDRRGLATTNYHIVAEKV
ncbi:MAG: methyltransferase domain-containing protein [Chlamydiae bacterium]|nr:methyltransferase domain-containing protein [Chlamydiota bacterium]